MATYNEALGCMCKRCMNYAVCNATGCAPKEKLQELIDSVNEEEEGAEMKRAFITIVNPESDESFMRELDPKCTYTIRAINREWMASINKNAGEDSDD